MSNRLLFDISTSMKWSGPPVGIVRVERELAKWAMENDPRCTFVFFDGALQGYREVRQSSLSSLLAGALIFDTTGMRDPSRVRPRKSERIPPIFLGPVLWVLQFRRMALRSLGALGVRTRSALPHQVIRILEDIIGGKKYRAILNGSGGRRCALVGLDVVAGNPVKIAPGDTVLFAGANWAHSSASYIALTKQNVPINLVVLCYDVIPLLYPHFFKPHDVTMLRRHFEVVFPIASLVLVTAKVIASEIARYCSKVPISVPLIREIPLGVDLPKAQASSLPAPARRFSKLILFVSTIEPRKGHGLALNVWMRLLAEGIPQRLDAALVFVGRPGWMVDDLLQRLSACDRVLLLNNIEDGELDALYNQAEFGIYPSEHEGYGLPVVEALARGKAVIASAAGVIPELHAELLRCLPPQDEDAWFEAIKNWLLNPPRASGVGYRHPTWQQAAEQVFAAIYESPGYNPDPAILSARSG
jgi:glycosyltransferase involved in cell wall biosynthesis